MNTPTIDLFKYNPLTDGDSTFNIDTALNENWDKIDEAFKQMNTKLSQGFTWGNLKGID